jgi:hypothetical protein
MYVCASCCNINTCKCYLWRMTIYYLIVNVCSWNTLIVPFPNLIDHRVSKSPVEYLLVIMVKDKQKIIQTLWLFTKASTGSLQLVKVLFPLRLNWILSFLLQTARAKKLIDKYTFSYFNLMYLPICSPINGTSYCSSTNMIS